MIKHHCDRCDKIIEDPREDIRGEPVKEGEKPKFAIYVKTLLFGRGGTHKLCPKCIKLIMEKGEPTTRGELEAVKPPKPTPRPSA